MQQPASAPSDVTLSATAVLARLRDKGPRVHCITNAVAQNFTANVLLSLGCVPSMTLSSEEIVGFVAGAQALLVNLGTFDAERRQATGLAVKAATDNKIPWVLDPVFVDRSRPRADFARALIARRPNAVRLNAAELTALANGDASPEAFARASGTVVGLSGATDVIADGARLARVANGHPLMSRVTAMGCAASALTAACLAVEPDALHAAAGALVIVGVAGELAGEKAAGPGSFAVAIIDALYNLDAATLTARAKVT
jgi:hydroxyethylthiazole kinase